LAREIVLRGTWRSDVLLVDGGGGLTDAGVVAEAVDDVELAEFCQNEHPRLVGILTLYTGDRYEAEELAQETLVRVVSHWRKVSGLDAPTAWTHRVALNLANSSIRRAIVRRRAMARLEARRGDPDVPGGDTPTAIAVRQAVASLPERQRTALVLRYYADLPVSEVSRIMRCKEGTVSALVHQAIKGLRRTPGFESMERDVARPS
jgi:RNA polymerase sigma factor (sigma-70 family)